MGFNSRLMVLAQRFVPRAGAMVGGGIDVAGRAAPVPLATALTCETAAVFRSPRGARP